MLRAVIVRTLGVILVIMLLLGVMVFFMQNGMIYLPPAPYDAAELSRMKASGLERIEFETGQGKQVAFYQPPTAVDGAEKPEQIWMVFGGNGGRAVDYDDVAQVAEWGYLFIDYPGYGLCEGSPTPKRIDETVDGAISALGEKLELEEIELDRRLCVLGHSLGGAVGLRAAVRHEIDQVVVLAPFTTMKEMAEGTVGRLYANVLRHRFDNVAALRSLEESNRDTKVTIMSGLDDRVVPWTMGKELADEFGEITEFHKLRGCGHNNIFENELPAVIRAMRGGAEE